MNTTQLTQLISGLILLFSIIMYMFIGLAVWSQLLSKNNKETVWSKIFLILLVVGVVFIPDMIWNFIVEILRLWT